MKKLTALVAMLAISTVVFSSHAGTPNSSSKSGAAAAFAKVNLGTGSLLTFGGKGTASAAVTYSNVSSYAEVTFTGKYPKGVTTDQLVITATCQSSNYGVANAYPVSVSSTQLVVGVYGWKSDSETYQGDTIFFTVHIGQLP